MISKKHSCHVIDIGKCHRPIANVNQHTKIIKCDILFRCLPTEIHTVTTNIGNESTWLFQFINFEVTLYKSLKHDTIAK